MSLINERLIHSLQQAGKMEPEEKVKVLPDYQDTPAGFCIAKMFSLKAFMSALTYEPRSDDLFIATYPKCGTTWAQNIVGCIYRHGKPFASAFEFECDSPFLEMAGAEAVKTMNRPGAIKIHLPFRVAPWSKQAKYLVIVRNPKDCCVSFYHHTKNIVGYKFSNGNFDDYFELFMKGEVDYGDYFDFLLEWYEHRNDENVLFLTYEQMKKDIRQCVLNIGEFLGQEHKNLLEQNETMLEDVIKYSSFDFMKQNASKQEAKLAAQPRDFVLNHPDIKQGLKDFLKDEDTFLDPNPDSTNFFRKGIVGDWRNHFTLEQNKRMEQKFWERTKGTDIPELWKDIFQKP